MTPTNIDCDLLKFAANTYSQNGEDGIITEIFSRCGISCGTCCEFGAWDGVHLSNCKALIERGWKALMIEGDCNRFLELKETFSGNSRVTCINAFVDTARSSLDAICEANGFSELDFLSIDIDGLDFDICTSLHMRPKVICVEINCGHHPFETRQIEREIASGNVGQPFGVFVDWASERGYQLLCFTGNAFFIRQDIWEGKNLPASESVHAYSQHLRRLDGQARTWLWLVGMGIVTPFYYFNNPLLSRRNLRISRISALLSIIDLGSRQNGWRGLGVRLWKIWWLRMRSERGSVRPAP